MSLSSVDFLSPEVTNTVSSQLELTSLPFPALFKLCAAPGFHQAKLQQLGYEVLSRAGNKTSKSMRFITEYSSPG